jgi:flagellar capping protein FliD
MGKLDVFIGNMVDATTVQVGTTVAVKGKVAGQIQTWQSEISNLDKRISDFQARLEQKRMRLLAQFSAAETNLAKLNEQLSWLASVNSVMTGNAANNS